MDPLIERQKITSGTLFELPLKDGSTVISKPQFMYHEGGCLRGVPWSIYDSFDIIIKENGQIKIYTVDLEHINHHNNFFESYMKYGYGVSLYEYAPLSGNFTYDIKMKSVHKSYSQTCTDAAQLAKMLADQSNLELCLFLSGGVDSEAMAIAFKNANVKFTPFIIKMNDGLNYHDIKYALNFCESLSITPKIYDFDVYKFLNEKLYYHYGLKYRSRYLEIQMLLSALDHNIDIFPVFPANIPFVVSQDNVTGFNLLIDQFHAVYRYLYLNRRHGIENFFYFTADQYSSAVASPIYNAFLLGKNMDYYDKVSIYNYFGFNVLPKKRKYTGWEKVKYLYAQKHFENSGVMIDDYFFYEVNLRYLDKFLLMEYKWPSSNNFN